MKPTTPPNLNAYAISTADWRRQLHINQRRTRFVIASFITIYLLIGLLIDTVIVSGTYPTAPLSLIFTALVTFKIFPTATCITGLIAIISLMITFSFHDKLMLLGTEYREITPTQAKTTQESQLYNVVEEMKVAAGLHYMPKVFLINAPYMNAFASGYSEKSAIVAITQGLIDKLDRDELQAVMAHELSHIRHMDIKLTLMASVLSNLMLIMIDLLFYNMLFSRQSNRNDNKLLFLVMILRWVLPLITVLLILYLSRTREFMADAGSVQLTRSNEPMARALLKIQGDYDQHQAAYSELSEHTQHESIRRQAYIFDPLQAGLKASGSTDTFSTHPSIQKRLEALGFKNK